MLSMKKILVTNPKSKAIHLTYNSFISNYHLWASPNFIRNTLLSFSLRGESHFIQIFKFLFYSVLNLRVSRLRVKMFNDSNNFSYLATLKCFFFKFNIP
jgi:hypothetical protein